jgi:serine/threonine protein kinase
MVLEIVSGGELFTYLQGKPEARIPLADARFFGACTLCALDYLHNKSILYRDLKVGTVVTSP